MSQKRVRVNRDRMQQGIDEVIFEIALGCDEMINSGERKIINQATKKSFATLTLPNEKAEVAVNLPKYIYEDNILSFRIKDFDCLDMIREDLDNQIKKYVGESVPIKIKRIECNITQQVSGNAEISDVLNFLCHSTLSCKNDNIKYVGQGNKILREVNHTVVIKRPHYWTGKFYDKTYQMIKAKNENHLNEKDIPENLLRMEFVFLERTLERLFGDKNTMEKILTDVSLLKVMREYKRVFFYELIDSRVKPYLNKCVSALVEYLLETEDVEQTIALERELIFDKEILQRALKRYMSIRRIKNNSARDAQRYTEKYGLPQGVIQTIRDFKKSCG